MESIGEYITAEKINYFENLLPDEEDKKPIRVQQVSKIMINQTEQAQNQQGENITTAIKQLMPTTRTIQYNATVKNLDNPTLSGINPENILKLLSNNHALVVINRPRVKGFCVECIKKKSDPYYKKTMIKVKTFCPTCPGGIWICESCFDEVHNCEPENDDL